MEKFKVLFIFFAIGIIFIPISYYLNKFTKIEASVKPKVTFNSESCYVCVDCPCTFTLNDGNAYTVNHNDKYLCDLDVEEIKNSVEKGTPFYTALIDEPDYSIFENCIKWHSAHPSSY